MKQKNVITTAGPISPAALQNFLKGLLQNPVVLFGKFSNQGTPACGFTAKAMQVLQEVLDEKQRNHDVVLVNILDPGNQGLREAVKQHSQWPTFPQLYLQGELIGGADIVMDLHSSGELLLQIQAIPLLT